MSHFHVMVRLPSALSFADIDDALEKALLPYKESGWGASDLPELKQHLVFQDIEDSSRSSYETKGLPMVRMPDGSVLSKYDGVFRNKNRDLFSDEPQHVHPPEAVHFEMPRKEHWATFEVYMKECEGYKERDPEKGRYGYWKNEQAKWDWYAIGGRWNGEILRVKADPSDDWCLCEPRPGEPNNPERERAADYCRIIDIDFEANAKRSKERLEKYWDKWSKYSEGLKLTDSADLSDEGFERFELREMFLKMGLIDCKDAQELTGFEWKKERWKQNRMNPAIARYDVFPSYIGREEFMKKYATYFNRLRTFAYLDTNPGAKGWVAPGKMGWWGMTSEKVDQRLAFSDSFMSWLQNGDQRDWVVVVDCHI